ncbi:YdcF family protein [Sulfurimonas sp.]|nr:YdcF family protein [Sulfurimonas sp.]
MEMGFLIKKWVSFFVHPYGMILSLFAFWLLFKYFKKERLSLISLSLALSFLFLFSYPVTSNLLIKNLEDKYTTYKYTKEVQYIHVLGSGHNKEIFHPISSRLGGTGIMRVIEGVIIYKKSKNSKLIFTGYKGSSNISNAKMHAKLALELGVKEEDIIIGSEPKDTQEEALFSKKVVGDNSLILVTSASHMSRAVMLFQSTGLNPIPAPTNFHSKTNVDFLQLPNSTAFTKSQVAMHEYIGILWSKLKASI